MEKISFVDVSHEVTKPDGSNNGIWIHRGLINPHNEVIIGMSPTNYHSFIICGESEYHPRFAFNRLRVAKARRRAIRAGLFFRIKGLSQKELANFKGYLHTLNQKRTPSCHIGVLQILEKGLGIKISGTHGKKLKPTEFIEAVFKYGFEHFDKKLEVQAVTTKKKTKDQIKSEIQSFEHKFRFAYALSDFIYFIISRIRPKTVII